MKVSILLVFLVLNALFWSLAHHSTHCNLLNQIGIKNCPSHIIHVIMGLGFFVAAIYVKQGKFWNKSTWH